MATTGAYVGTFLVGQAYVGDIGGGCRPDAVCGTTVCGAPLCGSWWTCAVRPDLILEPAYFQLLDLPKAEAKLRKPSLTLRAKTFALRADPAIAARKPALVLRAKSFVMGLDQTLPTHKATLLLQAKTAWGHESGLIPTGGLTPAFDSEVALTPTVPEDEVLVPTVAVVDEEPDWLLRPTTEESL